MITKMAEDMVKEADAVVGPIVGGIRASRLSSKQRKKLKDYYGLEDNASLGWRNAGRGVVGGGLGAIVGKALGNLRSGPAGLVAGAAGGLLGSGLSTNKYSKGNPVLDTKKKDLQPQAE